MEELQIKLAEILEIEAIDISKKFIDYDEYDSLAALTILAMLYSDYNKTMKASDIRNYASIEAFCNDVLA